MKSLLMTLMMLLISSAVFAAEIDGKWIGTQGGGTITFVFKAEGKKLYGAFLGSGDQKVAIQKGKIKKDKISFEVQMSQGSSKQSILYKGKIKNDNEIELTSRTQQRGPRRAGFGEASGGGFDSGFSSGLGGFGGVSQESAPFILKRVVEK